MYHCSGPFLFDHVVSWDSENLDIPDIFLKHWKRRSIFVSRVQVACSQLVHLYLSFSSNYIDVSGVRGKKEMILKGMARSKKCERSLAKLTCGKAIFDVLSSKKNC